MMLLDNFDSSRWGQPTSQTLVTSIKQQQHHEHIRMDTNNFDNNSNIIRRDNNTLIKHEMLFDYDFTCGGGDGDNSSSDASSSSINSSSSSRFAAHQASCGEIYTNIRPDPVYLEDDKVFYNLLLKESCNQQQQQQQEQPQLSGEFRHFLLSWMLNVCEQQSCQDEIFPLATMILDKFLLYHPAEMAGADLAALDNIDIDADDERDAAELLLCCQENGDLRHRRLYLFAACSLLLATKSRQTPRLYIQTLIEYSKSELPIELTREEILDGELLILATLKWDLAALVTPNDFIGLILGKCQSLLAASLAAAAEAGQEDSCAASRDQSNKLLQQQQQTQTQTQIAKIEGSQIDKHWSRIKRHTQTLLELCLMDSQLSQISPSILAMASVAVAIDGLSMTKKTFWRMDDIVANIYEATHKVNELKLMIEVAFQIEKYVQKLLNSAHDDRMI